MTKDYLCPTLSPGLDLEPLVGSELELEGICRGVIVTTDASILQHLIFGSGTTYSCILENKGAKLRVSGFDDSGDIGANIALMSSETNTPVIMRGQLERRKLASGHRIYSLLLDGIKAEGIESNGWLVP